MSNDEKLPEWELELQPLNDTEQKTYDTIDRELSQLFQKDTTRSMIVRYVRGYAREDEPVKTAVSRLRATLEWRKKIDAISYIHRPFNNQAGFDELWPSGVHGVGKNGHLIYIDRLGSVAPGKLLETFTMDHVKDFHIRMMERVNKIKRKLGTITGKKYYKHIVIIDLDGFGMSHMGSSFRGPMKSFIDIDQHHYPESLYKMIIVNAPFVFKMCWAIASPFVHPLTKQRIKMGSKHLKDYIDKEQLPKFLGGPHKFMDYKSMTFPTPDGPKKFTELVEGIEDPDVDYEESVANNDNNNDNDNNDNNETS